MRFDISKEKCLEMAAREEGCESVAAVGGAAEITPDTDLSALEQRHRAAFRKMVLDTGDPELRAAYYQTLALVEHEAARRARQSK